MSLEEYRSRRDLHRSPEPSGAADEPSRGGPIFVIQEHHASRLHYDFRLESGGVLKSWAVPKRPTLDPAQKRLAVQVEDHPLGYASFEGIIPEGHYGAGTVATWDRGTYDNLMASKPDPQTVAEAIAAGHLEFALRGRKLRGKFALIRMKGREEDGKPKWLLIKMRDEFARAEGPADLATGSTDPPTAAHGQEIELTHPDKILFPDDGTTKRDVFAYYRDVADRLLPFLKDRPVTLERLPGGLAAGAPHFWQKDTPAHYPEWIPRIALPTEGGKTVHYALVNDAQTLLYLVNQGALTFHTWASRVEDLDRPDFVLFDLDRGEASFGDIIGVARALRALLNEEGIRSFVKTSGKTGLHILTPWLRDGGYAEARSWALAIAHQIADDPAARATTEIRKDRREGRVYIDVLQNARGHHAVPPYVLRAVPGATVSMPLAWNELSPDLDPAAFTMGMTLKRLKARRRDPFSGLLRTFAKRQ